MNPVSAPPALLTALDGLREEAAQRYGAPPLVGLTVVPRGLLGWVATPAQADQVAALVAELWPGARARLLVLGERRARVGLHAVTPALNVWRTPPAPGTEPERVTQLLPGDPPAEVIAIRPGRFLVRAPGHALGWVARGAGYRLGTPSPEGDPPVDITQGTASWSPERVLAAALAYEGQPYVWGGTGATGMDCSGLLWRAFLTEGILLPRNSRAQRRLGLRVRREELQPADLLGAISRGQRRFSHVALMLGPGEVLHACSERSRVRREPLADFERRYRVLSVRRLPGGVSPGR
ncbi:MAG TPA: NlpC/P60 family protein [Candidatus Nanopelagicaceae bacterium]|nr:NlpC/P60 family protein [Candidatus Nanopelagicaceae bacterium]